LKPYHWIMDCSIKGKVQPALVNCTTLHQSRIPYSTSTRQTVRALCSPQKALTQCPVVSAVRIQVTTEGRE
jgi:hypothetical protein